MKVLASTASRVAGLLMALLFAASATGLLYLLRPLSVGPEIRNALPLDELSKRADVPLLLFVLVWSAVAAALGLVVRALRLERLTAAALLALAVGLWCFAVSGVSLMVVRQIPVAHALRAAAHLRAVYLPACLAALAGALAGRRARTPLSPRLLAGAVAAAAVLGFVPARAAAAIAPGRFAGAGGATAAALGFVLLVTVSGLGRGSRRAGQAAAAVLLALGALHELHGLGWGALTATGVAVLLLARRADLTAGGDPSAPRRAAASAARAAAVLLAVGLAAGWVGAAASGGSFSAASALRTTARAAAGLSLGGAAGIALFAAAVAGGAIVLRAWLAPWPYRPEDEEYERAWARALVRGWGDDTLAPFALRDDKSYHFADDRSAFLAYRVVGGVALVSGDPVGSPAAFGPLVESFAALARSRGWRVAVLGVSARRLELYRRCGLRALYHGDEAVLEVAAFSLEGRAIRKVRQSVSRLQAAGYRAQALLAGEVEPPLRERLERIAADWRRGKPARGFAMALDALFRLEGDDALFVVGRDGTGAAVGFLHFAVCRPARALSLSSMPRLRTTPNGFNEWLICESVAWARANGFERISLNFAPFAALLAPEARLTQLQRLERRALLALKGHFQLDNLLLFNRKFFPDWERRFVVYERRTDLPRVGLAALAAEAYLPFARRPS